MILPCFTADVQAGPLANNAQLGNRLIMLLLGTDNIRDVIAFPKTQKGQCLMTEAPGGVDEAQLEELHLDIRQKGPQG